MILDDWGLEPLDAAARHDLLEILEERKFLGIVGSNLTAHRQIDLTAARLDQA
jgi:hypothetical protein